MRFQLLPAAVVLLGLMAAETVSAGAANVYLAQSASGNANGTSCANAYAYSFFNATNNWGAGPGQIGPGTTVHLCGTLIAPTNASTNYLNFHGSGSSGNPITLLFEPGAVLTSAYWGIGVAAIDVENVNYIVVDGGTNGLIQATLTGTIGASCPGGPCANSPGNGALAGAGVYLANASNIEVKNLTVTNIYVHDGSGDDRNGDSDGIGVGGGGSHLLVHNNTIHDVYKGIFLQYSTANESDYEVYNNTIYNVNWGVAAADRAGGSRLTGLLAFGNTIHDFVNWNTTSDSFHHNGMYFWSQQGGGGQIIPPINIYNNYIYGDFGSGNCTAGIFMSQGGANTISSPFVFNNIIDQSKGACGNGTISANVANLNILGNVLIGGMIDGPNGPIGNGVVKNNTISGQGLYDTTAGLSSSDYNNWYNVGDTVYNGSRYTTVQSYVAATGLDTHSFTSNPSLSATNQPQSGSPLVGAGTNLYSVCIGQPNPGLGALCYDRAGNPRPSTGPWDIGAYQSATTVGSTGGSMTPPPSLAAVVQ